MPEKEKPLARLVDIYFFVKLNDMTNFLSIISS